MASEGKKTIRGTREWAVANIDCCTGCPHDCRYCYARYDAVVKKGLVAREEWRRCHLRTEDVDREFGCYGGTVMFPTTHDIVPEIVERCIEVIRKLVTAGNRVLVVSKPHLECVEKMCAELGRYSADILFRFTITARDAALLDYWEPGAPGYEERKASLCHAREKGFETSVSVEPMLDSADVVGMFYDLAPCVSHSIWIGKMNRIEDRVEVVSGEDRERIRAIVEGQVDEKIMEIYRQLQKEALVRWKESIKIVAGIELPGQAGLDI